MMLLMHLLLPSTTGGIIIPVTVLRLLNVVHTLVTCREDRAAVVICGVGLQCFNIQQHFC